MHKITVPGLPKGKGRPRYYQGRAVTPTATRDYEKKIALCWQTQGRPVFPDRQPVIVWIRAYFPIPKRAKKRDKAALEGAFCLKTPDSDNIAKCVLDALNRLAYHDDSVVQLGGVYKFYTNAAPRLEIELTGGDELAEKN